MLTTMKRSFWAVFIVFLAACGTISPELTPTDVPTVTPVQATALPSATPMQIITTPTLLVPVATASDQQVYLDPDGWFSVNIPAAWKARDAHTFSGEDGFFETGYMPEMMYRHYPVNICQWLANVETHSTYSIRYMEEKCALVTLPGITPATVQAIIANPQLDNEQRIFYIKTDAEHFDEIMDTFAWLRSVDPYREPVFRSMPMRSDDITFWENTSPLASEFLVMEYVLPTDAQNRSPLFTRFAELRPDGAPYVETSKMGDYAKAESDKAAINAQLKAYGYELKIDTTGQNPVQLYKDGNSLFAFPFDNFSEIWGVYSFSTPVKPIVAFVIRTLDGKNYLVQDDLVTKWGGFNDPRFAPILYHGELLWLRAAENSYVQIQTSQQDVVFSFATYFGNNLPVYRFRNWNDGWILEVDEYLVQNGEILNEKFGFEETSSWQLVNDKSFYFFRKGPRVGVSYDGKFLPLDYDEIAHGAINHYIGDGKKVPFYGKRDGIWYYVILEAK